MNNSINKKWYKCKKCELNYVENENELCSVCKNKVIRTDGYYDKSKYGRKSVCYNCRTQLNSQYNKLCPKCHWMICPTCGACRCTGDGTYNKKVKY